LLTIEKTLYYYKICPFYVNYEPVMFYNTGPWGRIHNTLFFYVRYEWAHMLEWLLLADFSSPVQCLRLRQELTQVKDLSGAPLLGGLLALLENIRLGWKSLSGTNTLAY
jgi:hypothetical protein